MAVNYFNQHMMNQNNTSDMTSGESGMGSNMNMTNSNMHLSDIDYGITAPMESEENMTAFPGNEAAENEGNFGLTTPVAPEGGTPAFPGEETTGNEGDYGLTTPIAPEGGTPAFPGNTTGGNMTGNRPGGTGNVPGNIIGGIIGGLVPSRPTTPIIPCPNCNVTQNYAQVRFLNASSNSFTVNISIDNTNYAINSRFGTVTNYDPVSDGFHTVTIRRASGLRTILLQQTFPFSAGENYTMVLVDTAQGGLNMVQVASTGCNNMSFNTGCYRVANMSYSGSSYDVMLYSHNAIFRNVGFQEVTAYKQAMAGSYQFYITNSSNISVIRELPILVIGAASGSGFFNEPLVSYQVDISAGGKYTSYLIGNTWSDSVFQVMTLED